MQMMVSHLPFGRHIFAEVVVNDADVLDDLDLLRVSLERGAVASGASVLHVCAHRFDPCGISVLLLLAESHASIHTYPLEGVLFFDAFTCGLRVRPQSILSSVVATLGDCDVRSQTLSRNPLRLAEQVG